jgi:CheY-like chemotaxis protein
VTVRVLVVDDHSSFRRLARRLLECGGFDVLGEAATGQEALRAVEAIRPQIVLLDVMLPDLNGLAVARILATSPQRPEVVLMSARPSADFDDELAGAPAIGFLVKDELTAEQIIEMIRR